MSLVTAKPGVELQAIRDWLSGRYGPGYKVEKLLPLDGGYWSSAFAYDLTDDANLVTEQLVLRLGASQEGYRIDQQAFRFASAGLPVPEVLDVGEALGLHYAISRRLPGKFLELAPAELSGPLCTTLAGLLATLRTVAADAKVEWYEAPDQGAATWHEWLYMGLGVQSQGATGDNPADLARWRHQLLGLPELNNLFERALKRIEALSAFVPERRELIHGDLLHQNVLINESATSVTGIFSWKCSAFGDYLYDLAWCTLWSSWFPALDAELLWRLTLADKRLTSADLKHVAERHHCYELQIAASHLGWFITSNDVENRERIATQIDGLLRAGSREL